MNDIRALVLTKPITALERLRYPGESGLTPMGEANVLDEVVGQFADPAVARRALDENLTRDRQIELIAARGDLPSSAAFVVDQDVVFEALIREHAEAFGDEQHDHSEDGFEGGVLVADPFVILAWAFKYHEREDWPELLLRSIGGLTVREHLLVAIWNDAGCPQVFEEPPVGHGEEDERSDGGDDDAPKAYLTDDMFDAVGLNSPEVRDDLVALIAKGRAVQMSRVEIDEAKLVIAERRYKRETAPLSSDAARGGSEQTKDELNF